MYLGEYPESFTYEGKEYTPRSFATSLEIKASDYITITSYTHEPFNSSFILGIPCDFSTRRCSRRREYAPGKHTMLNSNLEIFNDLNFDSSTLIAQEVMDAFVA